MILLAFSSFYMVKADINKPSEGTGHKTHVDLNVFLKS